MLLQIDISSGVGQCSIETPDPEIPSVPEVPVEPEDKPAPRVAKTPAKVTGLPETGTGSSTASTDLATMLVSSVAMLMLVGIAIRPVRVKQ